MTGTTFLLLLAIVAILTLLCLYLSQTKELEKRIKLWTESYNKLEERHLKVLREYDELKKQFDKAMFERDTLRLNLEALEEKLGEISEYTDSTPEDCVRGKYCEGCEFGKIYHTKNAIINRTFAICTRGKYCPNFIQKKEN